MLPGRRTEPDRLWESRHRCYALDLLEMITIMQGRQQDPAAKGKISKEGR